MAVPDERHTPECSGSAPDDPSSFVPRPSEVTSDLERFLDTSPDGVCFTDEATNRIISCNPAMAALVATTRGALVGAVQSSLTPTVPPSVTDDAPAVSGLASGHLVAADGNMKDVEIKTSRILLQGRNVRIEEFRDVRDRIGREEELRASEERYRTIVETTHEGVWVIGPDQTTTFVNARMAEILGCTPEEILGRSPFAFMTDAGGEDADRALDRGRLGRSASHERIFMRKDGSEVTTIISGSPLPSQDGTYAGALAMVTDITEHAQLEAEVRETATRATAPANELESLMDAVPALILIAHDPLCQHMTSNLLAETVLRVAPGSSFALNVPDGERPTGFRIMRDGRELRPDERPIDRAAATGQPQRDIELTVALDGDGQRHLFGSAVPLLNDAGAVRGAIGAFIDITDRCVAEAARDRHLRFAKALSEIADVVLSRERPADLLDEANRILGETLQLDRTLIYDVSFTINLLTGLSEWLRLSHPDIAATKNAYALDLFRSPFTEIRKTGRPLESHADAMNAHFLVDGSGAILHEQMKIKSLLWFPFAFRDDGFYVFTMNQILEHRRWSADELAFLADAAKMVSLALMKARFLEEQTRSRESLRKLNAELEQRVLERTTELVAVNKELDSFSHSVSHDLRAPIRAIEGFSSMVVRDHADQLDDEGKRLLGVVSTNVKKMTALIDALLTLSRSGRAEMTRSLIEMTPLATSVLHEVLRHAEMEGKIEIAVGDLPSAVGDPTLLQQVWANLLSNAVKFSHKVKHPSISIEGRLDGNEVIYSIRDNGAGFDMAHASRLFGTFQRLHGVKDFEGTGIGLALVRRIVTRHGGRVWAEGKVGVGATFSFALPVEQTKS